MPPLRPAGASGRSPAKPEEGASSDSHSFAMRQRVCLFLYVHLCYIAGTMRERVQMLSLIRSTVKEFQSLGTIIRNARGGGSPVERTAKRIPPQDTPNNQCGVLSDEPPIIPDVPPPQIHRVNPERRKDNTPSWKKWAELTALGVAIGVLIVNSVQSFYTRRQADYAQRQLDAAQKAFRMDERAWIEIDPIVPVLFVPRQGVFGAMFNYKISLRNVGKTAAHDVRFRASPGGITPLTTLAVSRAVMWEQDYLLLGKVPTGRDIPIEKPMQKVMAPNVAIPVPFTFSGQEPKIYPSGNQIIQYFSGRVDYCDAFQVAHWMKFCFYPARADGEPWNCPVGNDEDKNTEDPPKDGKCTLP
jgi:hypothetical protein